MHAAGTAEVFLWLVAYIKIRMFLEMVTEDSIRKSSDVSAPPAVPYQRYYWDVVGRALIAGFVA